MKKIFVLIAAILLAAGLLTGCSNRAKDDSQKDKNPKTELTVSAAASLKDALEEIQKVYARKKPEVKITYNLGSSGTLQQQIEQGSPADLFISAGKSQMDKLQSEQLIKKETRVDLLGNDLVLIVNKDNKEIKSFADLSKNTVNKISIGTPESVPAGKYAQDTLTNMKLWEALKPKLVMAKDVRQVLTYVETGNVDAGLVYLSDTKVSDKVQIIATAPDNSHKPIVYPAAVINSTKNSAAAEDFLNFLKSDDAQKIFIKYGFKGLNK